MTGVIVLGGGLAALVAAISAAKIGVFVTLVTDFIGGNSMKASSGLSAAGTRYQEPGDSVAAHFEDSMISGQGDSDEALLRVLTEGGADALAFLEECGVPQLENVVKLGGHRFPRTHRPALGGKPVGVTIMRSLEAFVRKMENVRILEGSRVMEVVRSEEVVEADGVTASLFVVRREGGVEDVKGDRLVIATGGYGRSPEFLKAAGDVISSMPSTNGDHAKGDGLRWGWSLGGSVIHLDAVQIHPTAFSDKGDSLFLAPEALRGAGGALLGLEDGKRFVGELDRRDVVAKAIVNKALLVLDERAVKEFGEDIFRFYRDVKKFFLEFATLNDLVDHFGIPKANISTILESMHHDFGPTNARPDLLQSTPLFAALIQPAVHYTMGGLAITPQAQLRARTSIDEPLGSWAHNPPHPTSTIPNVYAAGEVTGGVHGRNRLGGNSLLECVVFGRIAGTNAAKSI